MDINGEKFLFLEHEMFAKCSEINETMRDIDLSLCPPHFGKELN